MAEEWASIFERPHGAIEQLDRSWPSLVSPTFQATADGLRTYQVWHGIAATSDGQLFAHVARGMGSFDVSARIADLAAPALFISGSLDKMSPPEHSISMAERAPQGRYTIIEGAGYLSNADSADAFNSQMLDFLTKKASM